MSYPCFPSQTPIPPAVIRERTRQVTQETSSEHTPHCVREIVPVGDRPSGVSPASVSQRSPGDVHEEARDEARIRETGLCRKHDCVPCVGSSGVWRWCPGSGPGLPPQTTAPTDGKSGQAPAVSKAPARGAGSRWWAAGARWAVCGPHVPRRELLSCAGWFPSRSLYPFSSTFPVPLPQPREQPRGTEPCSQTLS